MAIKRYWRLVGIATPANGDLELSEVRLYEGGAMADTGATLTVTTPPSSGSLADLRDGSAAGIVSWSHQKYSAPGFALIWDFGLGGGVTSPLLRVGSGASKDTWLIAATLQFSSDGLSWETFRSSVYGVTYPGANALTAITSSSSVVSGAISYWPFDEDSGPTIADLVGPNSGTVTGATVVTGKVGRARSFNGSNQKANVPLEGFPSTSITICFWASPASSGGTGTSVLISSPDSPTNKVNIHLPWANNNIYWDFGDLGAGGRASVSFDNSWYNQLAFWEFSAIAGVGMKIYRNRVLLVSTSSTSVFYAAGKTLDFAYYAATGTYWQGTLDEPMVFGRELTSSESNALYNSGAGVPLISEGSLAVSATVIATSAQGSITQLQPAVELGAGTATSHLREHTFFDAYNGGIGTITGTVKEKNTPANTPLRRRVLLIDEASRITIRETWSDPVTGAFEFRGIKQGVKYSTISYDHLHNYRAVIADNQDAA